MAKNETRNSEMVFDQIFNTFSLLFFSKKLLTKVKPECINDDSLAHEKELNASTIKLDILDEAP
jgi:hypothetical protein